MSLNLRLQNYAINDSGTVLTIQDVTGNYDATTNPGGYGTPNPARNSVALFLRTYQKRYDGGDTIINTLLTSTPNNSAPTAVTSWDIALLTDSWLQATVYGLPLYSTSTLFSVNDLVWKVDTTQIIRIDTVSGSGPYTYTYTVMQQSDLENTDYGVAYSTVLNTYAIPSACVCLNKSREVYFKGLSATGNAAVYSNGNYGNPDWVRYQTIDSLVKSIVYGFAIEAYANAQRKIEQVENLCSCLSETCNC